MRMRSDAAPSIILWCFEFGRQWDADERDRAALVMAIEMWRP
jgi:hypothetical protein